MTDTSPNADRVRLEALRAMPSWRKLALIDGLNSAVKQITLNGIKARHPEFSPRQTLQTAASLWLGDGLAKKAFPL